MTRTHQRKTWAMAVAWPCLFAATTLYAQPASVPSATVMTVPRLVLVTGTFTPATGLPAAPVETVTLAVYAEETGGPPLWQEMQNVVVDKAGRFTLLFGATQPDGIPREVFASGEAQWLGLQFAGEGERSRARITSVPYALRSSDAETLGGRPASAYALASAPADHESPTTSAVSGHERSPSPADVVLAGTPNFLAKYVTGDEVANSAVYEAGGAVGIGTTTPFDSLHVRFLNTNGAFTGYAVQNLGATATSYSGMLFYDQNGALGQFQGFNNATHEYRINNIASGGSINFMIGGSSKFLVANNGNIGIGYPPQTSFCRLCVAGSATNAIYAINPGVGVNAGASSTGGTGVYGWAVSGWGVSGESNSLGVGVFGRADSGVGVHALSNTGTALTAVSSSGSIIATFMGPGTVGIGTYSPADKLDVAGDIRIGTGTTGCVKDAAATIIAGTCSSDARLKKNITPFASALGSLTQLQPVYFDWRGEEFPDRRLGNTRSFGLIAQDVEAVLPELVTIDADGYKAVKYSQLPFYMLQAIKDLKTENDVLKHRLELQEVEFSERLRRLEQLVAK